MKAAISHRDFIHALPTASDEYLNSGLHVEHKEGSANE